MKMDRNQTAREEKAFQIASERLFWWAMRNSNPRLSLRQSDTLPTELIARARNLLYTVLPD